MLDATAALGRIDLAGGGRWSALIGSAGAFGGPASVGLLVIRNRARWRAPYPIDDYQGGRWPGAPDVPAIFAAAVALGLLAATPGVRWASVSTHWSTGCGRDRFGRYPTSTWPATRMRRLPHLLTFCALYVDGEALTLELDRAGFARRERVGLQRASEHPSHVLAAMGALTHGNVRIGLTWDHDGR